MATSDRRRQRKLERLAAKRKLRRKELASVKSQGLAEQLAGASSAPVLDSLVTRDLWTQGMSNAVISRELPRGNVAVAVFLVDASCLGVKDAFGKVLSRGDYSQLRRQLTEKYEVVYLKPQDVRKLVEEAVAYARSIGLEPHPDYYRVQPIFGEIDPRESTEEFQFGGEDGTPWFIAGPHDSPAQCEKIVNTLTEHCGPDGFRFIVPAKSAAFLE